MWRVSKSAALTRRGVVDAAAGLGLHFLHMPEGPFSHDAGHLDYYMVIVRFMSQRNRIFGVFL